jgi:hypothetical protein
LYLNGIENTVNGGTGADIFIIGNDNIFSKIITDKDDYIAFDWFIYYLFIYLLQVSRSGQGYIDLYKSLGVAQKVGD